MDCSPCILAMLGTYGSEYEELREVPNLKRSDKHGKDLQPQQRTGYDDLEMVILYAVNCVPVFIKYIVWTDRVPMVMAWTRDYYVGA
jgi:hypothetical protein